MKLSILISFGIFISAVQRVDALTRPRVSPRQLAARRRVAARPVTYLRTVVVPVVTRNGERRRIRVIPLRSTNAATNIRKTNVNRKKDVKQTIIIAKTANIMSHVGSQNNDKTAISNKGSGSVQNSKPPTKLSITRNKMISKSRKTTPFRRQGRPLGRSPSRRLPSSETGSHGGGAGRHGAGSGTGHGQPVTIHIGHPISNGMGRNGHANGHNANSHGFGGQNFGGHGNGMNGPGLMVHGNGMAPHTSNFHGSGMGSRSTGTGTNGLNGIGGPVGFGAGHGQGMGPNGNGHGGFSAGHAPGMGPQGHGFSGNGNGGFGAGHGNGGFNVGSNLGLPVGHGIDFATLLGPLMDQGGVGANSGHGFDLMGHGSSGSSGGNIGGMGGGVGSTLLDTLISNLNSARSNSNAGLLAALVASGNLNDNLATLALLNSLNNQQVSVTSNPLLRGNNAQTGNLINTILSNAFQNERHGQHGSGSGQSQLSSNNNGHGAGVTLPTIVSAGGKQGPIIVESGGKIKVGIRQNSNGPPSIVIGQGGAPMAISQNAIEPEELV